MIEIKLHFTTMAAALAALSAMSPTLQDAAGLAMLPPSTPETAAPQAARIAAVKAAEKASKPEVKADVKAEVKAEPAVDYPTLQKAVFALSGAAKAKKLVPADIVLPIAKAFGFDNFKAMSEAGDAGAACFAAALKAVQAKTAEVAAMEVAEEMA